MHAVGSASPRTMRLVSGSVFSLLRMHVGALLSAKRAVYSVSRLRAGAVRKFSAARASSSTGEPMLSRHRSLPCQCDTCAVGRSSQHAGEIDEWGDELVQRDDYDRMERIIS